MKKLYLLLLLLITINQVFSQSMSVSHELVHPFGGRFSLKDPTQEKNFFNQFSTGLSGIVNNGKGGGSFDLSSITVKYFIPIKKRQDSVTIKTKDTITASIRDRYYGFDIYLINRATISTDSLKSMANDYLTSLQASPLTFRIGYEGFLTKNRIIDDTHILPVIKYRLSADARAVPYSNTTGVVNIGGSLNAYFSLLLQLKAIEDGDMSKDRGTFYLEPSIGFASGGNDLMGPIFKDNTNRLLFSTELRTGFISDTNKIRDWGVIIRYSWQDITGPNFKIGITVSPKS